ncbi:MAG: alanine racemase [Salana multivorans]|uniref:alanine racemase n=1 Tax=Salana multivorans TaxID=120377 RepID=UPI000961728B|nr:alanine racemase [Salana multivorans]OJX97786.1 MAG: alanine racemase [Micrococcales bacterium 73-15]
MSPVPGPTDADHASDPATPPAFSARTAFPARAVVDLDAIADNVRRLRQVAARSEVMAVLKADAYGHGLLPSARAALAGGATWLGVAQLVEAIRLREGLADRTAVTDPPAPRLLTWIFSPGPETHRALVRAIELDIDLSAGSPVALDAVVAAAREVGRPARLHLKVDTGLARGGQFLEPWTAMLADALAHEAAGHVAVVGLWSHLARAEEDDDTTDRQLDVFREALRRADEAGARVQVRHLANSAGTLLRPDTHFDLVRPGLAVFGLSPVPGRSPADLGLAPAMRLEADIMLVKDAPAGQGVSYGHTYTTQRATRLADLPLGYADGIPRHVSGVGPVQVAGRRHTIAGRVCMDQMVLDVGPDSTVSAGDTAVLWGSGRDGEPTAEDWARAAGTISYEIVTRLGARVPRVHVGTAGTAATPPADPTSPTAPDPVPTQKTTA